MHPKSNESFSYETKNTRHTKTTTTTHSETKTTQRQRGEEKVKMEAEWSDVPTSQGMPGTAGQPPGARRGVWN